MGSISFRYQNTTTFTQNLTIFNAINETPTPEQLYADLFRVRLRLKYLESPECRLKYSKEKQERERKYFTTRFRILLSVKHIYSKDMDCSVYDKFI